MPVKGSTGCRASGSAPARGGGLEDAERRAGRRCARRACPRRSAPVATRPLDEAGERVVGDGEQHQVGAARTTSSTGTHRHAGQQRGGARPARRRETAETATTAWPARRERGAEHGADAAGADDADAQAGRARGGRARQGVHRVVPVLEGYRTCAPACPRAGRASSACVPDHRAPTLRLPVVTALPWRDGRGAGAVRPGRLLPCARRPARHFRTSVTRVPGVRRGRPRAGRAASTTRSAGPTRSTSSTSAPGAASCCRRCPTCPARWRLTAVELAPDPGAAAALDGGGAPSSRACCSPTSGSTSSRSTCCSTAGWSRSPSTARERLGGAAPADAARVGRPVVAAGPAGRGRADPRRARGRPPSAQVRRGLAVAVDYGHVLGDRSDFGDRRPTLTGYRDGRQVHPCSTAAATSPPTSRSTPASTATGGRLLRQRDALHALGVDADPARPGARDHRPARLPGAAAGGERRGRAARPPQPGLVRLAGPSRRDRRPARDAPDA